MQVPKWIIALVLIAILGGGGFYWYRENQREHQAAIEKLQAKALEAQRQREAEAAANEERIAQIQREHEKQIAEAKEKVAEAEAAQIAAEHQPVFVEREQKLLSSMVELPAGQGYRQEFIVTESMKEARVTGNFTASGGVGNNVYVFIAGLYGKKASSDSFSVGPLSTGRYEISVSNQALMFSRTVTINATLHYKVLEYR